MRWEGDGDGDGERDAAQRDTARRRVGAGRQRSYRQPPGGRESGAGDCGSSVVLVAVIMYIAKNVQDLCVQRGVVTPSPIYVSTYYTRPGQNQLSSIE